MGQVYTIEAQQPTTYLDAGQAISGFLVTVRLHKWDEILQVNVPKLDPDLIDGRVQELIEQREALANLGG